VQESGSPSISLHFPNKIVLLSIGALASNPNFTARYSLTPSHSYSALQSMYLHSSPIESSYQLMKSSISKTSHAAIWVLDFLLKTAKSILISSGSRFETALIFLENVAI